eukprot:403360887
MHLQSHRLNIEDSDQGPDKSTTPTNVPPRVYSNRDLNWPFPFEKNKKLKENSNIPLSHNLDQNPFIMKFDFAPVKLVSITSDQKIALFGALRKILYMDFDTILRSKEKIKQSRTSQITSKIVNPDPAYIEGNPLRAKIIASLSDQAISVFDLSNGGYLLTLGSLTHQTCMNWSKKDENLIGSGSYDKIRIWDVRNPQSAIIIPQQQTNKIVFDRFDEYQFATAQDKVVRIWDQRSTAKELFHIDTHDSNIKNLDYDYNHSKLLLTTSQNSMRIYQLQDSAAEQQCHVQLKKTVITASFTPFGSGVVILKERSNNLKFFQLHEKDSGEGLFLKKMLYEEKNQSQAQIVQDLKIFQIRRDPESFNYQIVSLPSDKYLKVQKLPNEFVQSFNQNKLPTYSLKAGGYLQRDLLEINEEESMMSKNLLSQQILTQSDIIINELNDIEGFERVALDQKEYDQTQIGVLKRVELRLFIKDRPIEFKLGNRLNIDDQTGQSIIESLNQLSVQKSIEGQNHLRLCLMQVNKLLKQQNGLYQDENDEFFKTNVLNSNQNVGEDQPEILQQIPEKKYFIPYPRTNGFSWNNRGQLVTFSYSKYNFRALELNQKKKIFNANDLKSLQSHFSKRFNWTGVNQQLQGGEYDEDMKSENSGNHNDLMSDYSSNDEKNILASNGNRTSIMQDDEYSDSEDNDFDDDDDFDENESSYLESMGHSRKTKSKVGSSNFLKSAASGRDTSAHRQKSRSKKHGGGASKQPNQRADHRRVSRKDENFLTQNKPSIITIFNLESLSSLNIKFAVDQEIFSNNIRELCMLNSEKLIEIDQLELSKTWSLISICLSDINSDLIKLQNWSTNPLGKQLALRLLRAFEEQGDVQNIALLSALILGSETKIIENLLEVQKQTQQQMQEKQIYQSQVSKFQSTKTLNIQKQLSNHPLLKNATSQHQIQDQSQDKINTIQYKFPRNQEDAKHDQQPLTSTNLVIKLKTPKKSKETMGKYRKKSYQFGGVAKSNYDYFNEDEDDYDWLLKSKNPLHIKRNFQNPTIGSMEHQSKIKDLQSPQRAKSGTKRDNYLSRQSSKFFQKPKRKPSTPDNKNRMRRNQYNLFLRNDVDQLVDQQTIHLENESQHDMDVMKIDQNKKHRNAEKANMSSQFKQHWIDDNDENETKDNTDQEEEVQVTLMLKEEPRLAQTMLLYMKKYSELLLGWGFTFTSIKMCKIVAKSETLLQKYHQNLQISESSKSSLRTRKMLQAKQTTQSQALTIKDYLPFSENSLGYFCEKVSNQPKHQQLLLNNLGAESCQSCDQVNLICSICNLNVRGLMFVCSHCNHGGHYDHIKEWFQRTNLPSSNGHNKSNTKNLNQSSQQYYNNQSQGFQQQQQIYSSYNTFQNMNQESSNMMSAPQNFIRNVVRNTQCPGGCGCTQCYLQFS